jgi:hypothetical protein
MCFKDKMSKQTESKEKYYLYELALTIGAWKIYNPDPYSTHAVTKMVISAKTDVDARMIAIEKEWGGQFPGRNVTTAMFWGPTIEEQIKYIQCVPIGISFVLESRVICVDERHDSG